MNSTGAASVADLRGHLAALRSGLKTLHSNIFQCPTGELGEFLGELAELRALAGAASVIVTVDAENRGVIEASQSASTRGWVSEHGWHSRREATTIAKAAHILRRPDLAEISDSILTADLDLSTAVVVQGEYDKLAPELLPGAAPIVLKQMVHHGADHGPRGVRELRQYTLAHHGKRTSSVISRTAAGATSHSRRPAKPRPACTNIASSSTTKASAFSKPPSRPWPRPARIRTPANATTGRWTDTAAKPSSKHSGAPHSLKARA